MPKRNPYKQLIYHSKRHKNRNILRNIQRDVSPDEQLSARANIINDGNSSTSTGLINNDLAENILLEAAHNSNEDLSYQEDTAECFLESDSNSSYQSLNNDTNICRPTVTEPNSSNSENGNIGQQLAEWAINGQISHTHLNGLLSILRQHNCFSDLPKDSRTLLHTPRNYTLKTIPPGQYFHFGIENGLLEIIKSIYASNYCNIDVIPEVLSLQINVDGLPLTKSSLSQFWPIVAYLPHFPQTSPFLIGAYQGLKKPECSNLFLEEFVTEGNFLIESGFNFKGKQLKIKFSAFICDAPARAYIKKVKGHTGYYGCDRCIQKGTYLGRTVFPETTALLRTDEGFVERTQAQHHTGNSILQNISGIKMISQFPHDYMHLVCLGVMRKLTILWTKGDRLVRLSQNQISQMTTLLIKLKKHIPNEFARKPRPLSEIDRWKATEFRQFLLYTGPVVLEKVIRKRYYTHYLALHSAIRILADPILASCDIENAQALIEYFLAHFSELYGCEQMSYNVHSLVHLVNDVEHHGVVDLFSAFKFENYLQQIKRLIKKSALPLQQLVRRVSEQRSSNTGKMNLFEEEYPIAKGVHFNGPLILELSNPQYREIVLSKFTLKITSSNNCVQMKDGSICIIENVATTCEKLFVVGREFIVKTDFFTKPYRSSRVGVYKVKKLSHLKAWNVEEIFRKMIRIPLENNYFYTAVLLHN